MNLSIESTFAIILLATAGIALFIKYGIKRKKNGKSFFIIPKDLTDYQIKNAKEYYKQNREDINENIGDRMSDGVKVERGYKERPDLWTTDNWIWFKYNYIGKRINPNKMTGLEWLGIFEWEEDI